MKSLNLSRWALSLCGVAVLIAGCGGSQIGASQNVAPTLPLLDRNAFGGSSQSYVADTAALKGEQFSANKVLQSCHQGAGIHGGTEYLHYKASGNANGPFSGAFVAHGYMLYATNRGFDEKFQIHSGARTISGHVTVGNGRWGITECNSSTGVSKFFAKHVSYKTARSQGKTSFKYTKRHGFTQTFK